MVDLLNTELF